MSRGRSLAIVFAIAVGGSGAPDLARAQSKKEVRAAKLAIAAGQDHFRAERYKLAVAEFRRALQVVQDPGLIWNIARSYEELGDAKNAVHYFDQFSKKFPEDKDAPAAAQRSGALRPKVPGSVVVECGSVAGARVVIDGVHEAGCGERVSGLRPGAHVAALLAPGRPKLTREFFLAADERVDLGFDDLMAMDPAGASTIPPPGAAAGADADADDAGGASLLATSLLITAGALAVGAGVFAWMSHSDGATLQDKQGGEVRLSEIRSLETSSANFALTANILAATAAAAGLGGVILTF